MKRKEQYKLNVSRLFLLLNLQHSEGLEIFLKLKMQFDIYSSKYLRLNNSSHEVMR